MPTTIVSLSKLKSDLLSLTNSIQEDGYELIISVDEVTKYLKLEIADCIISDDNILVHLKIPIKRQGSQWRLYEVLAVPFAWENKTCTIQHAAPFLAVPRRRGFRVILSKKTVFRWYYTGAELTVCVFLHPRTNTFSK